MSTIRIRTVQGVAKTTVSRDTAGTGSARVASCDSTNGLRVVEGFR